MQLKSEIPNDYGIIKIVVQDINRLYNKYPNLMHDDYKMITAKNIFDRKQARKTNKKKIPTLKKQLPKLLESVDVNEVNSISLKNFKKNNSTTSAKSDTEYVDEQNIIRLSRKENNKEFVTWHDRDELVKWLKLKSTLPATRTTVTAADIKKIENSAGYGELIKISESTRSSTSRAKEEDKIHYIVLF
jgi:hypothetical protein